MSSQPGGAPVGGGGDFSSSPDMAAMMNQLGAAQKSGGGASQPHAGANQTQKPARDPANPLQEAKYFVGDVASGLGQIVPDILHDLLGIKTTDTPEEKAKKKQALDKFNQLSQQDRQFALQKLHQEQQKKQQQQMEEQRKKQLEAQQKQQSDTAAPTGKRSGMMAGQTGNSKAKASVNQMNQKRQQLSSAD